MVIKENFLTKIDRTSKFFLVKDVVPEPFLRVDKNSVINSIAGH